MKNVKENLINKTLCKFLSLFRGIFFNLTIENICLNQREL